jgi:hypothetical protein
MINLSYSPDVCHTSWDVAQGFPRKKQLLIALQPHQGQIANRPLIYLAYVYRIYIYICIIHRYIIIVYIYIHIFSNCRRCRHNVYHLLKATNDQSRQWPCCVSHQLGRRAVVSTEEDEIRCLSSTWTFSSDPTCTVERAIIVLPDLQVSYFLRILMSHLSCHNPQ